MKSMNNINFVKKINIDKQPPLMPILIVQGKLRGVTIAIMRKFMLACHDIFKRV